MHTLCSLPICFKVTHVSGLATKTWLTLFFIVSCITTSFSQGGKTCTAAQSSPLIIGQKYTGQTTCGMGNNYTGTGGCSASYTNQDWTYYFCATKSGYASFNLENVSPGSGTNASVSVSLFNGCPGSGSCIASNTAIVSGTSTVANLVSVSALVSSGQCYYLVVDGSNASPNSDCINYTLTSGIYGITKNASCINMDFEDGTLDGWFFTTGSVSTGAAGASIPNYTASGYAPVPGRQTIVGPGGTDLCGGFPLTGQGNYSLRLGNNINGAQGEQASQTFLVTNTNALFTYRYAVVFEDPQHGNNEQPFFTGLVKDDKGNIIACSKYIVTAGANIPGFLNTTACTGTGVKYKPWSTMNVDLTPYIGTYVTVEFTVGDCTQGGHYGYAYVDAECSVSKYTKTDTICTGECATITAPPGYKSYLWTPGNSTSETINVCPSATTIYTVTLTTADGCLTKLTDTIVVTPKPIPDFSYSTIMCKKPIDFTDLSTIDSPNTIKSYSWKFQDALPATSASANPTSIVWNAPGTYSITLTTTSNNGCTASITKAITITTCGVSVEITGDTICENSCYSITAIPFSGIPPYTFNWSPAIGTGAGPHQVCPLSNTIYTVTITDNVGNTETDTAGVFIYTPIAITMSSTGTKCLGDKNGTATATPSGGFVPYTYLWNTPTFATTPTVTGLGSGIYSVTVTDANGCTAIDSVLVTDPPPLTLTVPAISLKCFGDSADASTLVSGGTPPYTYSWSTGQTSAIANGLKATTTYVVEVKDNNGCSIQTTVTPTEPTLLVPGISATAINCFGDNSVITASANGGTPNYSFIWSDGSTVDSTKGKAGLYSVTVTDANGCTATDSVLVTDPPPLTLTVPAISLECFGDSADASTLVSGGTPPYTYSWSNGQTLAIANGLKATSTYIVEVKDNNGCSIQTTVTPTEPTLLVPSISTTALNCFGDNSVVTASANGGTPNYNFKWSNGSMVDSIIGKAGTYSVTVTDANGCTAIDSVLVTDPPPLTLTVPAISLKCFGDSADASTLVSGGTPPYTYSWSTGQTSAIANGLKATSTYIVEVKDNNGCSIQTTVTPTEPTLLVPGISATAINCFGDNSVITASANGGTPTYNFKWSNGSMVDSVKGKAGTYSVIITDANNCTASTSVTVTEPPLLSTITPSVNAICIGQSTTLTSSIQGGTPPYTHLWTPGSLNTPDIQVYPIQNTTYTLIVTDAGGCVAAMQTIAVNVKPPLSVDAGLDKTICIGQSVALFATATGGDGNYLFNWLPDNKVGSSITVSPKVNTTYTVFVTDGCGTIAAADTVKVIVNPLPISNFVSDAVAGCVPLCVKFTNANSDALKNCKWEFGDGTILLNCNPTFCYRSPGKYNINLTVTDTNNCTSTQYMANFIEVFSSPKAAFIVNPKSTTILEPTIAMEDRSTKDVVKWDWNFGNETNSTSTKKNPTYTYSDTGKYKIRQIVTTQFGCVDTAYEYVYIVGDFTFYVPNAFSPNKDGKNETFFPKGFMINPECYQMHIFDRWGDLIFETNELSQGWDGHANNGTEVAQQDVYVWKILVCDYMDRKYRYMGHVTLVK